MFNGRVAGSVCDQNAGSPQICNGDKSVASRVYFLRDGCFIFNSYKDPVVRKERFLRARLTWLFPTPYIFIAQVSVQVGPVLLNVAFNGRKEIRKTSLSRNHLSITASLKANFKINAIKKGMCRNTIKVNILMK